MSDLIDRKAAIKALGKRPIVLMGSGYGLAQRNQYDIDKLAIETVPSSEPEQKTGTWILAKPYEEQRVWWECSVCGHVIYSESEADRREFHAYCGRCGAKMEGRANDERPD